VAPSISLPGDADPDGRRWDAGPALGCGNVRIRASADTYSSGRGR
jgi:hypothetical protein